MNSFPCNSAPGKKVLILFHGFTSVIGGSEYLPLLLISELQKHGCFVTLALKWKSDIEQAKHLWAVDFDIQKVNIVYLPFPQNRILWKLESFLPFYSRNRKLKELAKNADICISASNIADFGKPSHHIVCLMRTFCDFDFIDFYRHDVKRSGFSCFKRKLKNFVVDSIFSPLFRMRSIRCILADQKEHIYVPSYYVANTMRAFYGPFNCTVFYPPTTFDFTIKDVKREPLQVNYIGRIAEEKHIEDIIRIVELARDSSGLDLKLVLAGRMENTPYCEKMKRIAQKKTWVRFIGLMIGENKERFLLSGTYAIHAERDEAFGISITEYLKAGSIPIVPDEGGTVEIVDSPALTYHANEDAAAILTKLLQDEFFRQEQLTHCAERAKAFTMDAYLENQRLFLDRVLSEA